MIVTGVISCVIFFPLGNLVGQALAFNSPDSIPVPPRLNIVPKEHPDEDTLDLGKLLSLSRNQLEGIDIAVLNLACAKGLPGGDVDIPATRRMLDQWAERVRSETERNHHLFTDNPAKFYNSESFFKAIMMVTILHEDMGVHYNDNRMKDGDWSHGEDFLMYGLTGNLREGTCSTMPVLYVAIGRRLGYPLYLAATQRHVFCRWESDDGKVRFNLEGTGDFVHSYSDSFYRNWPLKLSYFDMGSGVFLRNMSGVEEFASFLMIRGDILEAQNRLPEAEQAYAEAHALIPGHFFFACDLAMGLDKEAMLKSGLLNPDNPNNPFRHIAPNPDTDPPSTTKLYNIQDDEAKR